MRHIDTFESNEITHSMDEATNKLVSIIQGLGYRFPIEEANIKYKEALGLDCPEFDPENSYVRMLKNEFTFMYGDEITWATFIKLSNQRDYCIIKVIHGEVDNASRRKKIEKKIPRFSLTFISHDDNSTEINKLLETLTNEAFGITQWSLVKNRNKKFVELSQKYTSPTFTEDDYIVAKKLDDSNYSSILLSIKSSGSLIVRDLMTKFDKLENISQFIEQLKNDDMIKSEYVVLCKKTSEQINKAPSRESIDFMGTHGIRCSKCNRLITEETIEELLTTTELCNRMLNGSLWMTINLVESLLALGVPLEEILVNIEEGPEEIDAVVNIEEHLLLFELKDSQFSLGHAYPFQSRVGVYGADTGVIWATKGIAPEVKEHFNRVKPKADLCYIESIESLLPKLSEIISNIRWSVAESELNHLSSSSLIINNIGGGIMNNLKQSMLAQTEADLSAEPADLPEHVS